MNKKTKLRFLAAAFSAVACLSVLSVTAYVTENNNDMIFENESKVLSHDKQEATYYNRIDLSNTDISTVVSNFFNDYYSSTYLEHFKLDLNKYVDQRSGLKEYLTSKIPVEKKRNSAGGYVTDFSVNVDVKKIEKTDTGYSVAAWITIDFKYPGCDDWSGMGRSAELEIANTENGIRIKSVCVNDDIDSIIIGNIENFDCQTASKNWYSDEYLKERIRLLSEYFNAENKCNYEYESGNN